MQLTNGLFRQSYLIFLTFFGIGCLLVSLQLQAHHSRAEFTGDIIELEGELTDVRWNNPHPTFKIRLSDGSGEVWDIQSYGGLGQLAQLGFDAAEFEPGKRVTFAGLVSSRRPQMLLANNILMPDGLEVVLRYNGLPYWNGPFYRRQRKRRNRYVRFG